MYGTVSTERYPYYSKTYLVQNHLPSINCFNPASAACATLESNTTQLYKLPHPVGLQKYCQVSQSQLVRVRR